MKTVSVSPKYQVVIPRELRIALVDHAGSSVTSASTETPRILKLLRFRKAASRGYF